MTNAARIPVTLDSDLLALAPAKVQPFLTRALDRGLTVWQNTTTTPGHSGWTIESTNPIDTWQLWLYFTAGTRTGTLTISRYAPDVADQSKATRRQTQAQARVVIDDMGDALDRHNARRDAHDLDTATAGGPHREAAVRAVKATTATAPDADTQALAVVALGSLKANGRFAIRAASRGMLPRNVPTKVRHALVRRGLVAVAGGMLTDVGRVARWMILNP